MAVQQIPELLPVDGVEYRWARCRGSCSYNGVFCGCQCCVHTS